MEYQKINLISNYLAISNNEKYYKLINDAFINDSMQFELEISKNKDLNFVNNSPNETLEYSTLIFCKFAKENIFECLFNTNQHFYNYSIGENVYANCNVLDELIKLGFDFKKNDEQNKQINLDNSIQNGHDGLHFFAHCPIKLLLSNFKYFSETFIICINDPQLVKNKELHKINNNDLNFKQIYVNNIVYGNNPLYLKELFQYCSEDKYNFNRYLKTKRIGNQSIFDILIDNFKKIEYAESDISNLLNCKSIIELKDNININYTNFEPQKYKESIDFLTNAKNLYFNMIETNTFDVSIFVQKLDEICPGQLYIFDEKYQIEQFREEYGGKEFKERFLNNLSKSASILSEKEIKKLFSKKTYKEIIKPILDYNKQNPNKQIPILMLVNDFKELDKKSLNQLEFIINKYMQGQTEYLYDYLVRQEELDMIIEKSNITLEENIKLNTIKEKLNNKTKDIEKTR